MTVSRLGLYLPGWGTDAAREAGHDEDVVTLAVAAGLLAIQEPGVVRRVVVVTPAPDVLEGFAGAVVAAGLGLDPAVPAELRVGGAPATLEALDGVSPGTLVIGVDPLRPAGAAAALMAATGEPGVELSAVAAHHRSLPMRVQHTGRPRRDDYDDARVERERGWVPALAAVLPDRSGEEPLTVVGVAAKDAARLGGTVTVATTGASAPLFALAELAQRPGARIVALDSGSAARADVVGDAGVAVERSARPAIAVSQRPSHSAPDAVVPFSMPAYERAFDAKIGFLGANCSCGIVDFPPRSYCSGCGRTGTSELTPLPRTGTVYTGVEVHVPVPGIPGPYAVAIAQLDEMPVRVLGHVTDSAPADPRIGSRGRFVLRRVATREGVPDYGYAWQPELEEEVAR